MSNTPTTSATPDPFAQSQTSFSLGKLEIVWLVVTIVVVVAASVAVVCVLCRCKVKRSRKQRRSRGTSVMDGRNQFPAWNPDAALPLTPEELEASNLKRPEAPQQQLTKDIILPPPPARTVQFRDEVETVSWKQEHGRRRSSYFNPRRSVGGSRPSYIGRAF